MSDSSLLFEALQIRDVEIPNRIFVSPMCQYSAFDGFPSDWHSVHYGSRAVGGAGLVISEAVAISPEGRISWGDLGIWDDEHAEALAYIAALISGNGSVPAIQLAHAGRKASSPRPGDNEDWDREAGRTWPVISSTSRPFSGDSPMPRAIREEDIPELVTCYTTAARRAIAAGFRVLEIHSAHGYLLHQFLSPLCNDRKDGYGGDFNGRTRIVREIVAAVRSELGEDVPVFVRISAVDWRDDGWQIEDSVRLAGELKAAGADLIDCSSGGISPGIAVPAVGEYQVPFSLAVRDGARIATGAVGNITSASQAESILASGKADAVLLGREFLRNPYWPRSAAKELGVEIPVPGQYLRAW